MMSGQKKAENIAYLIAWAVLFAGPLLSMYVEAAASGASQLDWHDAILTWRILIVFCFTFAIHNFLLAPFLVYRGRKMMYVLSTIVLIVAVCVCQWVWTSRNIPRHERRMPPQEMVNYGMPPKGRHGDMRPMPPRNDFRKGRKGEKHSLPMERQFMMLVMILLLLGMNVGTKYFFKTIDDRKRMKELERQNLKQQLEYLKYQINPHFFMNTLNNIHALVDIDPEEAKHTIEVLSKLMRYVLYDSNRAMVPLRKELEFVKHYIGLMRIRYTECVRITLQLPDEMPEGEVPPLLFITFVENAFKHGVSYDRPSFVEVKVNIVGDKVLMVCRNSLQKRDKGERKQGGVGMENAKKRLELIYKNSYKLEVKTEGETYCVIMEMPIRLVNS